MPEILKLAKYAIDCAWCMLIFISEHFESSPACQMQVMYALQHNVPIIPVKLQANWLPTGWLASAVSGSIWADLSGDAKGTEAENTHKITVAVKQVTGLEFSGGLTPRPGDAPIMQPPKRALTADQKTLYESLNERVKGMVGWASWTDVKEWAAAQSPPIEVTQIQLIKVDRDLYGNFHCKQVASTLAAGR